MRNGDKYLDRNNLSLQMYIYCKCEHDKVINKWLCEVLVKVCVVVSWLASYTGDLGSIPSSGIQAV